MSRHPAEHAARHRHLLLRWAAGIGLLVLGIALYSVCINVYGGYPKVHSQVLDWIGVVLIIAVGTALWMRYGDDHQR